MSSIKREALSQRNQVGLMVDVVACIVGEKPKYEVPPIDFL
jgi:hypothetical protein